MAPSAHPAAQGWRCRGYWLRTWWLLSHRLHSTCWYQSSWKLSAWCFTRNELGQVKLSGDVNSLAQNRMSNSTPFLVMWPWVKYRLMYGKRGGGKDPAWTLYTCSRYPRADLLWNIPLEEHLGPKKGIKRSPSRSCTEYLQSLLVFLQQCLQVHSLWWSLLLLYMMDNGSLLEPSQLLAVSSSCNPPHPMHSKMQVDSLAIKRVQLPLLQDLMGLRYLASPQFQQL